MTKITSSHELILSLNVTYNNAKLSRYLHPELIQDVITLNGDYKWEMYGIEEDGEFYEHILKIHNSKEEYVFGETEDSGTPAFLPLGMLWAEVRIGDSDGIEVGLFFKDEYGELEDKFYDCGHAYDNLREESYASLLNIMDLGFYEGENLQENYFEFHKKDFVPCAQEDALKVIEYLKSMGVSISEETCDEFGLEYEEDDFTEELPEIAQRAKSKLSEEGSLRILNLIIDEFNLNKDVCIGVLTRFLDGELEPNEYLLKRVNYREQWLKEVKEYINNYDYNNPKYDDIYETLNRLGTGGCLIYPFTDDFSSSTSFQESLDSVKETTINLEVLTKSSART